MIFHASIPADDPERVARVIAELWRCEYFPFIYPGSFIVIAEDGKGTEIEVQPRGQEQVPGETEVGVRLNRSPAPYSEVHINLSMAVDAKTALAIAEREGWIARECDRGGFKLIEFWLENKFMLELMTAPEIERYKKLVTADGYRVLLKNPFPDRFGLVESWLTGPRKAK